MRRRISTTVDECLLPAENKCKENVPKSQRNSSMYKIADKRTLMDIRKYFPKAKHPSSCWARRDASDPPPRVDTSTVPCCVRHRINPSSVQAGYREVFTSETFHNKASSGRDVLKCNLPPKPCWQGGSPLIRAWLRVDSPSDLPFPCATAYHMREDCFPLPPRTQSGVE